MTPRRHYAKICVKPSLFGRISPGHSKIETRPSADTAPPRKLELPPRIQNRGTGEQRMQRAGRHRDVQLRKEDDGMQPHRSRGPDNRTAVTGGMTLHGQCITWSTPRQATTTGVGRMRSTIAPIGDHFRPISVVPNGDMDASPRNPDRIQDRNSPHED
jgi:hypothetical protein